jgi:hypothetical protein
MFCFDPHGHTSACVLQATGSCLFLWTSKFHATGECLVFFRFLRYKVTPPHLCMHYDQQIRKCPMLEKTGCVMKTWNMSLYWWQIGSRGFQTTGFQNIPEEWFDLGLWYLSLSLSQLGLQTKGMHLCMPVIKTFFSARVWLINLEVITRFSFWSVVQWYFLSTENHNSVSSLSAYIIQIKLLLIHTDFLPVINVSLWKTATTKCPKRSFCWCAVASCSTTFMTKYQYCTISKNIYHKNGLIDRGCSITASSCLVSAWWWLNVVAHAVDTSLL